MAITPQSENISQDSATKTVYKYYDKDSNPIFKAKEIFKNQAKIILHPYYANKRNDNISQGGIKTVELVGWQRLEDL